MDWISGSDSLIGDEGLEQVTDSKKNPNTDGSPCLWSNLVPTVKFDIKSM